MKKILAGIVVLLAVNLTACAGNEDNSDSGPNSVSENSDEENEAAQTKIITDLEYAVKNDIKIDGVPVTIPCRRDELLASLGDKYSFDDVDNLMYEDKETMIWVVSDYNDEDMIKSIGFRYDDYNNDGIIVSEINKGVLEFASLGADQPYSLDEMLSVYAVPYQRTEIGENNNSTRIQFYSGEDIDGSEYVLQCVFTDNNMLTAICTYYDTE